MRCIVIVISVVVLAVAATASGQGIRPLTNETQKEALAATAAKDCESMQLDPILLCVNNLDYAAASAHIKELANRTESGMAAVSAIGSFFQQFPYQTNIASPYCQLAKQASDAARSYQPFTPPALSPAEQQTVQITVSSGSSFVNAGSIKHMVIKRDGVVIQPVKEELRPEKIQNRMGASREVVGGVFTFPASAFVVGGTVTLVWIGPDQNWEFTFTSQELEKLK